MGPTIFSPDPLRADFTRLITNLGIDTNQVLVQPFILRAERPLDAARSNYEFDLLSTPASDRPSEVKLNRNDAYAVMGIRLGIQKQDITTTPKQYANTPTLYSADPNYFSGAPAGLPKEYVSLQVLYNSRLSLKTQVTDRLKDLHTGVLEQRPERGFITIASSSQTNPEFPQQAIGVDGFFRLIPNPILSGQDNNRVSLTLGEGDIRSIEGTVNAAAAAVTTRNVVVLEMFGYLLVDQAAAALRYAPF